MRRVRTPGSSSSSASERHRTVFSGSGRIGAIDAINKITLGGRRALIVGPTWFEQPIPEPIDDVADAVRQVAEDAGVPYLDALDPPLLTRTQMQPDLSGPTDAGQSVLADRIAEWVRSEVSK